MVKHHNYVKYLDVSLMLNIYVTFCYTAVVAQVDQYAEVEYSMVSTPTISKSSIDLSLKVKNSLLFKHLNKKLTVAVYQMPSVYITVCLSHFHVIFRVNFTT